MPFDPNIPATNAEATSEMFRGQFNGLHDLIEAKQSITGAQIDAINTLNPGEQATASATVSGSVLHLTLGIPRGNDGATGATGATGSNGQNGNDGQPGVQGIPGPPGQPFAIATVDSVTTLPPGSAATATASFDGSTVHLSFGLPSGNDGPPGAQGIQGSPGEVTNATLAAEIAGTSNNTNGMATLNLVVSDPPTQAEVQSIANKLDELILALRR